MFSIFMLLSLKKPIYSPVSFEPFRPLSCGNLYNVPSVRTVTTYLNIDGIFLWWARLWRLTSGGGLGLEEQAVGETQYKLKFIYFKMHIFNINYELNIL